MSLPSQPSASRFLLGIESSTDACSVALMGLDAQGEVLFCEQDFRQLPRQHTQFLLPMVEQCLSAHALSMGDISAIAFARGPGSFTGLRVCAATVQGLAAAVAIPVLPVSSLAAMAYLAFQDNSDEQLVVSLDARMDEVYWARYSKAENGLPQLEGEECLSAPEQLALKDDDLLLGSGLAYAERMTATGAFRSGDAALVPTAEACLALARPVFLAGEALPAEAAVPVYLRDRVAWQ